MNTTEEKSTWYGRNGFIIWSALKFGIYLGVFFLVITTRFAQAHFVAPFTHTIGVLTSFLLNIVGMSTYVDGTKIIGDSFQVQVVNGCNGVYVSALVSAAILAAPADWMKRVVGVAFALFAIYVINLARATSLFLIGAWKAEWFEFAHVYVWQTVVVLSVLAIFLAWTGWSFAERPPFDSEAAG